METSGRADFGEPIIQSGLQVKSCKWRFVYTEDYWETECDVTFIADGPEENHYNYCPFCGGKIEEVKDE